jgi:hypothetical protein
MNDPIFAAIDTNRTTVARFWTEHTKIPPEGYPEVSDWQPSHDALMAWNLADKELVDTVPTTDAGLRVLETYLRNECTRSINHCIWRPLVVDGVVMGAHAGGLDGEGIDYLIAMRATGDRSRVSVHA